MLQYKKALGLMAAAGILITGPRACQLGPWGEVLGDSEA